MRGEKGKEIGDRDKGRERGDCPTRKLGAGGGAAGEKNFGSEGKGEKGQRLLACTTSGAKRDLLTVRGKVCKNRGGKQSGERQGRSMRGVSSSSQKRGKTFLMDAVGGGKEGKKDVSKKSKRTGTGKRKKCRG